MLWKWGTLQLYLWDCQATLLAMSQIEATYQTRHLQNAHFVCQVAHDFVFEDGGSPFGLKGSEDNRLVSVSGWAEPCLAMSSMAAKRHMHACLQGAVPDELSCPPTFPNEVAMTLQ